MGAIPYRNNLDPMGWSAVLVYYGMTGFTHKVYSVTQITILLIILLKEGLGAHTSLVIKQNGTFEFKIIMTISLLQ